MKKETQSSSHTFNEDGMLVHASLLQQNKALFVIQMIAQTLFLLWERMASAAAVPRSRKRSLRYQLSLMTALSGHFLNGDEQDSLFAGCT